jgi:enediyne biosynthesis protein E4
VISTVNDRAVLLHNESGGGSHWLTVKLTGTRGNRDAIGARITLRAGSATQMHEVHGAGSYLSQSDLRAHFGLGSLAVVPSLEIRWPGGATERFTDVAADETLAIDEGKGIVSRRGRTAAGRETR